MNFNQAHTMFKMTIATRTIMAKRRRIAELEAILSLITFSDTATVDAYKIELWKLSNEVRAYENQQH